MALAGGFLAVTAVMVSLKKRLVGAEARQRQIANRDPLTGIANRRAFDQALRRELAARANPGRRGGDEEPLALLIVDLDDFKAINDELGHPMDDAVLCETAARARSVLRSGDVLARLGGDEFAVIAPGAHGDGAERLGEAICHAVAAELPASRMPAPNASVGLAVYPEDGEDFETLLRVADQRLLRRKSNGRHFAPLARGTLRLI